MQHSFCLFITTKRIKGGSYYGSIQRFKLSRRLGISLSGTGKELEKRPYAPGQHGPNQRKNYQNMVYNYVKTKLRYLYGMTERQFRNTFDIAGKNSVYTVKTS